jgi:hypothetical protein
MRFGLVALEPEEAWAFAVPFRAVPFVELEEGGDSEGDDMVGRSSAMGRR